MGSACYARPAATGDLDLAKKKKADGPKGKKDKGARGKAAKLPKRIAGVKVPKPLRESGGKLLEAVTQPLVMDIAAAALIAAAARIRDEAGKNAAARQGADATPDTQDVGAIIAATAAEGLRRIADAALASAKAAGGGGNGRASRDKDGARS